jgi:hypothetical protein
MTTHYFLEKGHCNQMNSKLHQAISTYFSSLSGTLIEASELEQLKEIFLAKIILLNMEYHRHKPVTLSFNIFGRAGNISVQGIDGMNFILKTATLYTAKSLRTK